MGSIPQNSFGEGPGDRQPIPVAVIGMGFRGPGDATNVDNLYKLLREARETWSPIPESKWNAKAFYHPDAARSGTSNVRGGHFFKGDLTGFDAPFFNLSKDEASCLDPQQRLLLECTYEAFESSGTPMSTAVGTKTSVFVGTFTGDYPELLYRDGETIPRYQATGASSSRAMLSNRLSYYFDFTGPSATVDTACSASLVGFHLAFQSIQTGDAEQAVCAGSSVILNSDFFNSMSSMGFFSPEGRCYSFDERAQGYGRGEGVGCVLLKPLHKALQDGDPIRAVVLNTGSNQDGKTNGITLPSATAQESLIRSVYKKARLDPLETSYVEAHGTGTQAGDPIETSVLGAVFGPSRPEEKPLMIGSIKSNLGHLEGASGVASIIKGVLMLENQQLLPSRNYKNPNKRIKLDEWRLKVATEVMPWAADGPRRMSINGFGYGGSNAHVVLEDPFTFIPSLLPDPHAQKLLSQPSSRRRLFALSAYDKESLKRQASNLSTFLETQEADGLFLDRLAYTLAERRSNFPWRAAVSASSVEELISSLQAEDLKCVRSTSQPTVGLVFTGQGAQSARMGMELMDVFPVYRRSLEFCTAQLKKCGASWDLIDELAKDTQESRVGDAEFSQPVCTAVQCALVDLFRSWNVQPIAVTGHSSGEIASAYCAGTMSLEKTMTAAYFRGVVAGSLSIPGKLPRKGCMMAVAKAKTDVVPLLAQLKSGKVVIACENSPQNVTVSGDVEAVDELHAIIKEQDSTTFARKLQVDVAYHSHHMQVIGDEYLECIPPITAPEDQSVQFFSSVLAEKAHPSQLDRSYWVTNLLSEVRFSPALSKLCHEAAGEGNVVDFLLEVGPHSALAGPIKQIIAADPKLKAHGISYASALVRNKNAVETVMECASSLITQGYPVDVGEVNGLANISLTPLTNLPPYSWNHSKSYWAESRLSKEYRNRKHPRTDVLGVQDKNFNPMEPRWRNIIRLSESPWLRDHEIQQGIIFPGGGFLAMVLEAATQVAADANLDVESYTLREVQINKALLIPDDPGEVETLLTMKPYAAGTRLISELWMEFYIYSVDKDNKWSLHCQGMVGTHKPSSTEQAFSTRTTDAKHASVPATDGWRNVEVEGFYSTLKKAGLNYGPTFARLHSAQTQGDVCVAQMTIADIAAGNPQGFAHPSPIHPSTFDCFLHPIFAPMTAKSGSLASPFVPVSIDSLSISAKTPSTAGTDFTLVVRNDESSSKRITSSIEVSSASEKMIHMEGLRLTALASDEIDSGDDRQKEMTWNMAWSQDPDLIALKDISKMLRSSSLAQVESLTPARNSPRDSPLMAAADKSSSTTKPIIEPETPPNDRRQGLEELSLYAKLMAFKNPELKALELNSYNAEITLSLLGSMGLADGQKPNFSQYDVGVVDESLTESMKSDMGSLSEHVDFKTVEKGLEALKGQAYDFIVVNLLQDLEGFGPAQWKEIMRIGGKVIMLQSSGSLQESQSSEDQSSGSISRRKLQTLLDDSGFKDFQGLTDENNCSMFMASLPAQGEHPQKEVTIIQGAAQRDAALATSLKAKLEALGYTACIADIDNAGRVEDRICIMLAEVEQAFLSSPTESQYELTRDIFLKSHGVIWLTRGASAGVGEAATSVGFARTARAENGSSAIVTLDLDPNQALEADSLVRLVTSIFQKHFVYEHGQPDSIDLEYREEEGRLLLPRALPDVETNEGLHETLGSTEIVEQPLIQDGRPLRMDVKSPGMLSSLYWDDNPNMEPSLPSDSIEVEVKAAGVNFRDVMMALGQIEVQSFGAECSGVITEVGSDVLGLSPGDRVAFCDIGTLATKVQTKASLARRIPSDMDFETAAALPIVYCTAYFALIEIGRLKHGESVLIHAASGGVGQAAIELCTLYDAEVFVTVGTEEKRQMMIERFGIPTDHILFSRTNDFARDIMEITKGRGVDVILNSVAGEAHRLTWETIGAYGRFIELGKRDIFVNTRLEMQKFKKNVTFAAFDLVAYIQDRPEETGRTWQKVLDLLAEKKIRGLHPITSYPASDLTKLLQKMQTGKHLGKMVVTMGREDRVQATVPQDNRQLFSENASYLIIGGLGGLGYTIASWMISKGARHLIFASRSGMASEKTKALVDVLNERGANVHVAACDVSKLSDVESLLAAVAADGRPPVKGLLHAAMLLKDSLLENLTVEDYKRGLSAKVQGTLNLHKALPKDLDFFIMLSSIIGVVGNASQASYSAANAFMDSFAQHRTSLGLPAVALDLGVITDVGHLAENTSLAAAMARQGFAGTTGKELLAMVQDAVVRPHRKEPQVISGLGSWSESSLAGLARPQFSHFRNVTGQGEQNQAADILSDIKNAQTTQEAVNLVCSELMSKLSELCMIPLEDIIPGNTPSQYGVDSLVAVELRTWVSHKFKYSMPLLEMLGGNSLKGLSGVIAEKVRA